MAPTSPVPAALSLSVGIAFCCVMQRGKAASSSGRFRSLDGLRGYLALCVFISHACLWYFYLRTGRWETPPSRLYVHLGESSVALFFMITGFLFIEKLLDARARPVDWTRLFVSRLLRLGPAFLCAVSLVFAIVACLSKGTLHERLPMLLKHVVEWLAFTILGGPDLNGMGNTWIIVAGVTWTLPYEWAFYLSLPLLGLCLGVRPPAAWLVVSALGVLAFSRLHLDAYHVAAFLGGGVAAMLSRSARFCRFAAAPGVSFIVIVLIAATIESYPSAHAARPLALLSLAFACIACGNTLFGVLVQSASCLLGEMAYSIYLLHGILLYVLFNFVIGLPASRSLTPLQHWLLIVAVTPVLLIVCHWSFLAVELPAMNRVTRLTAWLRANVFPRGRTSAREGQPMNV